MSEPTAAAVVITDFASERRMGLYSAVLGSQLVISTVTGR